MVVIVKELLMLTPLLVLVRVHCVPEPANCR